MSFQDEIQKENDKFNERIRDYLNKAMQLGIAKMRQEGSMPLKSELMRSLAKQFESDYESVKAIIIPDESLDNVEHFCLKNKIPYFPFSAANNENMILISQEDYARVYEFAKEVERINPNYQAWSTMKDFAETARDIGEESLLVLDIDGADKEEMDFIINMFTNKMHSAGTGKSIGIRERIADMDGDKPIYDTKIAVRLEDSIDSDINTPDFLSTAIECAIDSENSFKMQLKSAANKIDNMNTMSFINSVLSHNSCYLGNAYRSLDDGLLRYDSALDTIYFKLPGSETERIVCSKNELNELRNDPNWQKKFASQLSHYTASINDMKYMTPAEKIKLDKMTTDELSLLKYDEAYKVYERIEKNNGKIGRDIFRGCNVRISLEDLAMINDQTHPLDNLEGKSYKELINDMMQNSNTFGNIYIAQQKDAFKKNALNDIAKFVKNNEIALNDLSEIDKINIIKETIVNDLKEHGGMFKDSFKILDESFVPIETNDIIEFTDNLFDRIDIVPTVSILAREAELDDIERDLKAEKEMDKDMDIDKREAV